MDERGEVSLTRLMLLGTAVLALSSVAIGENVVLLPVALFVSTAACIVLLVAQVQVYVSDTYVAVLAGASMLVAYLQWMVLSGGIVPLLLVGHIGLGLTAVLVARWGRITYVIFLVLHLTLVFLLIATVQMTSDVRALVDGGASALLQGVHPYAITVPGVYGPDHNWVYGSGVLSGGRIQFGYPYLPVPLLAVLPAYLLGDIRFVLVPAMLLVSWIAARLATDRLGRVAAVLVLVMPVSWAVQLNFWVEPILLLAVALAARSMARNTSGVAVWFGCFLASKQYAIVHLPYLWLLLRRRGRRSAWVALSVPFVLCGVFVLWDAGAFWHSAVEFHFRQPYRDDTVTLTPMLERAVGSSAFLFGPYGLVLGGAVSLLISWRCRPSATNFAAGIGLSLAIAVLFSKQGHANYWQLIGGCLLLAVACEGPVAGSAAKLRAAADEEMASTPPDG